jgi:Bacterial PH domain
MSDDFDFETATGVPDVLPLGERIMWQGRPSRWALLRHVFHADIIVAYFTVVVAARLIFGWHDGLPAGELLGTITALLLAAALALSIVGALAWQAARTTVYTLTTRCLIMRYGMALPITLNIPLARITAAKFASRKDASGDIAVTPEAGARLAYMMLWPHVRAWHIANPEPALRCVPDVSQVAQVLQEALAATAPAKAMTIVRLRAGTGMPVYRPSAQLAAAE